ncbi:hypothetical protein EIP91_003148 [Steccherinum ochraceum]|uniref:RED-like N-terminal domain-containing protein n=1 Tax=Steccherinum ochraceum TaxID=92696 RepID=A0A4R0RXP3_9APHY|nr:hypothetical protein EIP91_003148 [Steccherinum ochraceum]
MRTGAERLEATIESLVALSLSAKECLNQSRFNLVGGKDDRSTRQTLGSIRYSWKSHGRFRAEKPTEFRKLVTGSRVQTFRLGDQDCGNMDQDHFRKLLSTSSNGRPAASTSSTSVSKKPSKSKSKKADEPAFKPRAVKKASTKEGAYRDRATERRLGKESDYAQIEALAEDFEKRAAAENTDKTQIEEQRKYLGGDGDHSVLVKGLDFALLEQNKAKAFSSAADDDTLEQAFLEGTSAEPAPSTSKKRTREDIVRELKTKRPKTGDGVEKDLTLDEAKKAGKFKPIGFKPIGGAGEEGKKKKVKKVKKKKAVEGGDDAGSKASEGAQLAPDVEMKESAKAPVSPPEPEPEDVDIFADAGEYTGLDLGDDDEDDDEGKPQKAVESDEEVTPVPMRANWFDDKEEEEAPAPPKEEAKSTSPHPDHAEPRGEEGAEEDDGEEDAPMRLVPLQSSSIPSIKDILAMDDAAQKDQKRKARKEKKKGALGAEGKVDRDYQRLKSYTEKKAAASS